MKEQFGQFLYEAKKQEGKISLFKLPFGLDALSPVMNKDNVDYHYNVHTKNYIKKANADHDDFNVAGAKLHNLWWEQLQPPSQKNEPTGEVATLITKQYKTLAAFKSQAKQQFMGIQGSGWLVLLTSGKLITVANHRDVSNVALLIDGWEHAYYSTYGPHKDKYFDAIWTCINWDVVNTRIQSQ